MMAEWFSADFNPRSPHGERPCRKTRNALPAAFQPTLPARGATRKEDTMKQKTRISTHAPRTGSDIKTGARPEGGHHISTHAPRTGSDRAIQAKRRARWISTHAPRTGSDTDGDAQAPPRKISTHAPRTGSDTLGRRERPKTATFQPTLPARGATAAEAVFNR